MYLLDNQVFLGFCQYQLKILFKKKLITCCVFSLRHCCSCCRITLSLYVIYRNQYTPLYRTLKYSWIHYILHTLNFIDNVVRSPERPAAVYICLEVYLVTN